MSEADDKQQLRRELDARSESLITRISNLRAANDRLERESAALAAKYEACKMEARCHAQEARTANATIADIYKLCTGATGEPGNWHGAEPVRRALARYEARAAELRAVLERIFVASEIHSRHVDPGAPTQAYNAVHEIHGWAGEALESAPGEVVFQPTHRHAEGGLYQHISAGKVHMRLEENSTRRDAGEEYEWVDGEFYRNAKGMWFSREKQDFDARFAALTSAERGGERG